MKNILKLAATILGFGILASCSSGQKKEETKTADKPAKAIEVYSVTQPIKGARLRNSFGSEIPFGLKSSIR